MTSSRAILRARMPDGLQDLRPMQQRPGSDVRNHDPDQANETLPTAKPPLQFVEGLGSQRRVLDVEFGSVSWALAYRRLT